jgi:hypothetical protein
MILVINIELIKSFVSGSFSKVNILLIKQALVDNSNGPNVNVVDGTSMFGDNIPRNSEKKSTSVVQFLNEPSLYGDYVLSLERRTNCNLRTPTNCFGTKKSLVITFWSQKSSQRWLVLNLLSVFPEKYYDYMVMIYDNSSWNHHPAYAKAIWIHVKDQLRFWYVKRFVPPHILRAYRYIWIIDDDARFYFNPRVYECVADKYNISLSAPARGEGVIMHEITKVSPRHTFRIGRWTDFVEIGPIFIAKGSVWICLWNYLSEKVGLGYGLDEKWCRILSKHCFRQSSITKICAILDAFVMHHDSTTINTLKLGMLEISAYKKYINYSSKKLVFGAVASDSTDLHLCTTKLSKV